MYVTLSQIQISILLSIPVSVRRILSCSTPPPYPAPQSSIHQSGQLASRVYYFAGKATPARAGARAGVPFFLYCKRASGS
eukprot:9504062-Pyramimonas_sp.AAC.2